MGIGDRESLSDLGRDLREVKEEAMQTSGEGAFQAEGTASAKARG